MTDKPEWADNGNIEASCRIICAYVANNPVPPSELPGVIESIFGSVTNCTTGRPERPAQEPAVPVNKSITPDYIISLEDGRKFRTLTRHLKAEHGMTPQQYREKWGLPDTYPMIAPSYSTRRSEIAKDMQLGRKDSN